MRCTLRITSAVSIFVTNRKTIRINPVSCGLHRIPKCHFPFSNILIIVAYREAQIREITKNTKTVE